MGHDLDRGGDGQRQECSCKPGQAAPDERAHDDGRRWEVDRVLVDPRPEQVVFELLTGNEVHDGGDAIRRTLRQGHQNGRDGPR